MCVRSLMLLVVVGLAAALPSACAEKLSDASSTGCAVRDAASEPNFSDIETDPRKTEILLVARRRILQGYPDGTFRPKAMVSEREFGDVIDRLLVACPQMTKPAFDSKNPHDPITRLRAVMVVVRAIAQKGAVESITDPRQKLANCSDFKKIPEWGRKDAAYAVDKGFLTVTTEFRPSQPISRSELAELLAKCLPPAALEATPGVAYTGLIVDCTGLKLARSMCPAIESEDGTRIYPDPKHLPSIEFMEDHGLVSYSSAQADSKRTGEKPLIVKALGVGGSASQVAIVSDADKNVILEAEKTCHFLSNWNVTFVVDAR